MALHGSVGEFDPTREDWTTYNERLGFYFEANGVTDAKQRHAIFLSCSGLTIFQLVCSLASPQQLWELTFKEITELLDNHYNPKKSATVQCYKFNTHTRHPSEIVSTYIHVAELKKLAVHCSFERGTLNTMLCDRLVCGINDQRMQCRLLAELELDYDKALTLALTIESADQNASALEKTPPVPEAAGSSGGFSLIPRPIFLA